MAAALGHVCPQPPVLSQGLSGVWELDVVIFICLYPNFLLWGNETSEEDLDTKPRGARKGARSTYKELLLALRVPFQDCVAQL